MKLTIGVRYSCHLCGLRDVEVQVPARETEDVLDWMNITAGELSKHHQRIHPFCQTTQLSDVKIPMDGADRIGGAPVQ